MGNVTFGAKKSEESTPKKVNVVDPYEKALLDEGNYTTSMQLLSGHRDIVRVIVKLDNREFSFLFIFLLFYLIIYLIIIIIIIQIYKRFDCFGF